ncbi:MAG: DegT/DnrJ/EryC1/StrS family aminotransferase [Bacteroidetes bacterium]|nr:DegT/DnrJ/EryC1/StrS family aminotransferase [Bacteroidota bacterium]
MEVPYHRYLMGPEEEAAALRVLHSGWLTTGAESQAFAAAFCTYKSGGHALAVNSCTDGLRILLASLQLPAGSEVIVPPMTFASTAHVVLQNGLVPVFADVVPGSLSLDPGAAAARLTSRTRAMILVHVAGHMCDMDALTALARQHDLYIIEDCAHALESSWKGQSAGSLGYGSSFSFYANKNMTTGEGGMVWVQETEALRRLGLWRNHGLDYDAYTREQGHGSTPGFRQYDILLPGYKCALPDLPAALGRVQLARVPAMHERRTQLARRYTEVFAHHPQLQPLMPAAQSVSAWHLYIVRLEPGTLRCTRDELMTRIMARGVGLSLHFKPLHLFTAYRQLGWQPGDLPASEDMYARIFSLPIYPLLTDTQQEYVIEVVLDELQKARK